MNKASTRSSVFISYSHRDRKWLEMLRPHFSSLARDSGITTWDDTNIRAGQQWREEIEAALASAKVAILLVSAYFLDSDFITQNEVPSLLASSETDGAVVLQVIVSPCRVEHHPVLSKFQYVNPPSKTLRAMSGVEREELFVRLTERVEEILGSRRSAVPTLARPLVQSETIKNGPIVVFEYDRAKGWKIRNLGTSPALDLLVSERAFDGDWVLPIRLPPLGPGEDYWLRWVGHRNVDILGARYSDAARQVYSAVCQHDNSEVRIGSVYPEWSESQIQAHWKV